MGKAGRDQASLPANHQDLRTALVGHATIELTVSTYGRWLKKKAPGALDRLDFVTEVASGSKVVAKQGFGAITALTPMEQGPYLQALTMEPATRIERATCGLRISE